MQQGHQDLSWKLHDADPLADATGNIGNREASQIEGHSSLDTGKNEKPPDCGKSRAWRLKVQVNCTEGLLGSKQ